MASIALVTSAGLPELDEGERLVIAPLQQAGAAVDIVVWDDPDADWNAYDLAVVRTTWDYIDRRDEFLAWADTVPRLANPAPLLRWNTDKSYLAELATAGLPVVPTLLCAPGAGADLPDWDGEIVVKPLVSAGARATARYAPHERERGVEHLRGLHADGQTAMVQPYVAGVDEHGETALLHFGGVLSHAIRKGALLAPGAAPRTGPELDEPIEPRIPSEPERATAASILDHVRARFGEPLYARVDLVPGPDGAPLLIELEVTEPSLFLQHDEGAPGRFARAILEAARR